MQVDYAPNMIIQDMFIEYSKLKGTDYLIDKAIEEMAELIQELIKYKNGQPDNLDKELADVLVTLVPIAMLSEPEAVLQGQNDRVNKIVSHIQELKGEDLIAKSN
jgi:NTP pyrophosphatase (non-canonical NTP hydrolase)